MMCAPHHRVKVRLGRLLVGVFASLLVLAASVGSASATVENRPIHQTRRLAGAGAMSGAHARSSLVRRAVVRERLSGVRLLVPRSGYDTARGSAAVRVLQRRLAEVGAAPGAIDGRYGPLTARAVARFQAAHGLAVDGIAGPKTLAALAAPIPVLFPGAGKQQPGGSPSVRALQRRLAGAGWPPGPIDGRYGRLTTEAVERFQAGHGLRVDGIVGSHTWRALILMTRAVAGQASRARRVSPRRAAASRGPRQRASGGPRPRASGGPRPRASGGQHRAPGLPVGLVLLGVAALGLLSGSFGYARASARVRRALANQRQRRAESSAGLPRAAWHARNGGLVRGAKEGER
jgi:peptidoglycan hydrolase-like protein with peptidoglycan-binding domain